MIWDNADVLEVVRQFSCVKVYLCGHNHVGEVVRTNHFVQINVPGIIEARPEQQPFGIIEVSEAKMSISSLKGYWEEMEFYFNEE